MTSGALAARVQTHLRALADLEAPLAYVDLDAFDANGAALARAAGSQPVRIATKSLRCDALIDRAIGLEEQFRGAMAFTIDEALHLAARGIDDVLIGYPSAEPGPLARLAAWTAQRPDHRLRPMVDATEQLDRIAAAARAAGTEVAVCVDLDASWRPAGARGPAIGRSAHRCAPPSRCSRSSAMPRRTEGVRVDALMAYDGQVAGVGDAPPGRPLRSRAIQLMQRQSLEDLYDRVPRIVAAVERELASDGGLRLVNVGGTGSLSRMRDLTAATELTAGSASTPPALFDAYRHLDLQPAAFFVLPWCGAPGRAPSPCSAAATSPRVRPGPIACRCPSSRRACGSIATRAPARCRRRSRARPRAPSESATAWRFRHARLASSASGSRALHLVRGSELHGTVPTYRGAGLTFL